MHKRVVLKLGGKHPAMALFDGFRGQTIDNISSLLAANNIVAIQLPPNYMDKLQPLDLSNQWKMAWKQSFTSDSVSYQLSATFQQSALIFQENVPQTSGFYQSIALSFIYVIGNQL